MERGEIGRRGEEYAARYLTRLGYQIRVRNFRVRTGEIDLIAIDRGVVVFVEVRYRKMSAYGSPAESVDFRKRRRLIRAARAFLGTRNVQAPCRFDVIGLHPDDRGGVSVEHIRNAFDAEGRTTC